MIRAAGTYPLLIVHVWILRWRCTAPFCDARVAPGCQGNIDFLNQNFMLPGVAEVKEIVESVPWPELQ